MKKITVNKTNIKKGTPGSTCGCPIALALRREFPGKQVSVSDDVIEIYEPGKYWCTAVFYHTPNSAKRFIKKFDNKQNVEPFTFALIEDK